MSCVIEYYFSMVSPWAYIGHRFFSDIAARRGARIVHRPVALHEVFSQTGGLPLAKRHPARQAYRMLELQRWRRKRELSFHLQPRHWPFDPGPADRAVLALTANGADPAAFIDHGFAAVWERQEDLGDAQTLAALLRQSGFDAAAVLAAADAPETRAAYERNRVEAIAAGVFGAPSYVLGGEIFWGQDRLDLLDDALASGRPPFRAA
jgi:2-hydroxychromene-2-carboxylate isomerase